MEFIKNKKRSVQHIVSAPIIWSVLLPLVVLDIWIELYHQTCFRLYGLPRVQRSNYIKIDRHKLQYLNWYQKINCAYCGYVNGLMHYWATIVAETEKYWCGIMHKEGAGFIPPKHHKDFVPYDDRTEFIKRYH